MPCSTQPKLHLIKNVDQCKTLAKCFKIFVKSFIKLQSEVQGELWNKEFLPPSASDIWKDTNTFRLLFSTPLRYQYKCTHINTDTHYIQKMKNLPQFLVSLDLSGGEETDAGEAKILVVHKHFDWNDVGLTEVIDKTAYVSITPGINAVGVTILAIEEVVIIHEGLMNRKWSRGPRVKGLKH